MHKPIIVFDLHDPNISSKDLFSKHNLNKISHTLVPTYYLVRQLSEAGFLVYSAGDYLKLPRTLGTVFLISYLVSNETSLLLAKGVIPLILICQESPFIATRFYWGLPSLSKRFKHSFVFSGMKKWISRQSIYNQMFFPQSYRLEDFNYKDFNDKKLVTMVTGAKSVGNWKKNILLKVMYGFSVKEIYSERLRSIEFFSNKDGFDLYGRGWDKFRSDKFDNLAITRSCRGEVDDKFEVLKGYKFTLCFENSIFPGYITEKVFDAIFAGSVPIYYGAPDIKKYISSDIFIDFRDFKDYDELYSFISTMSREKYQQYLIAIRNFIYSDACNKFSQKHFINYIFDILNKEPAISKLCLK